MDCRNRKSVRFTRVVGDINSRSTQTTNQKPISHLTTSTSTSSKRILDSKKSTRGFQRVTLGSKKKMSTSTLPSVQNIGTVKKISRIEQKNSSEWNKVYLDHPEIIKDKAKRLVTELEKKRIILNESSIERIIRGDPKEYLQVIKKIFVANEASFNLQWKNTCQNKSVKDLLSKLEGKTSDGVAALFGILSHVLNYNPALNPFQFMQNRYTIQKLILCNEIIQRLYNYRPPVHI